jgi:hypothetical protein
VALKRSFNVASLFGALILTAYMGLSGPVKQSAPSQYFPETGHTVREPFITYFTQTGGLAQHGFPITDDYVEADGTLVQYFEKSRMEWHPGNPEPYQVQLGLLGDELGKRAAPIPISKIPPANDPNCLYFPDTGHSLCLTFRDYYLQNGGLDRFGYPITEFTIEDGHIVQYFQRARMEWHPEKLPDQPIQLAQLGKTYYMAAGLDPTRLQPSVGGDSFGGATTLHPRASVVQPVTVANGQQTAFVFVTDQLGRPIGGASVTLVVHFPDGDQSYNMPPTTANGTTFRTFALPQVPAGTLVSMDFQVAYSGLFGSTRTSCFIWY